MQVRTSQTAFQSFRAVVHAFLPGVLLVGGISAAAMAIAGLPSVERIGLGTLTIAIILGIALGNTVLARIAGRAGPGVDFAKGTLLRTGIILYGMRITLQDIAGVGAAALWIDIAMVGSVFALAVTFGTRIFKLDRQTAMLIGAGSAICGAAAVLATEPVVRGEPHKVSVAVATVVVFGTLAMFGYPLLYPHLGMDAHQYGLYAGSTIHEVAQVVVAGNAAGEPAAAIAVISKMLRVMLLAPFLLLLSAGLTHSNANGEKKAITIPWFALWFILVSAIHSLQLVPPAIVHGLVLLDTLLLTMAMAALGLRTHIGALREAGLRPLLLAASLSAYLMIGGYLLNLGIPRVLAWLG